MVIGEDQDKFASFPDPLAILWRARTNVLSIMVEGGSKTTAFNTA